jgi:hypothetical protein
MVCYARKHKYSKQILNISEPVFSGAFAGRATTTVIGRIGMIRIIRKIELIQRYSKHIILHSHIVRAAKDRKERKRQALLGGHLSKSSNCDAELDVALHCDPRPGGRTDE